MTAALYRFTTEWDLVGTAAEVADVLADPLELPRWWPSVYLAVAELTPGGQGGVGRRVLALTKGFLPYTLSWSFRVVESRYPNGFTLEAEGDFEGQGVWSIEQRGAWVHVRYDWRIEAKKPWMRLVSPVARPVFAANHRWAMRRGEESLKLELARRRAATELERALLPAPPRPTTTSPVPFLLAVAGTAGAILGASLLIARAARPRRRFRIARR